MKKMKPIDRFILVVMLCCITICSCGGSQRHVRDLEVLTEDLVSHGDHFTEEEWIAAIKEYERIESNLSDCMDDYDYEERRQIAKLETICNDRMLNAIPLTVKNKMRDVGYVIGETVDGIVEVIDEWLK